MTSADTEEELDLSAGMVPHHHLGPVTGYDHDSGLPIVRRHNVPRGTSAPEKEDTPDGKRDVLHASKDREELVAEGKAHAPHLESGLKEAADSVPGANLEGVRSEKDPERLDEKIKREGQPVETVPDVLAGRISVDNDDAHKEVVDDIKKHATVVREKDEFKKGDSRFAFRSHKLQVKVSPKMSAEVQVVPKEVAANDKKQHPVYEKAREAELDGDTEKADSLAQKSKVMNDEAKSRFDRRNKDDKDSKVDGADSKRKVPESSRGSVQRRPSGSDAAGDNSHKVGDRVTLPNGKAATVAYAPSKSSQLPTYRFKGDDGSTTTMRASEAHAKVKQADDAGGKPKGWVGVDLDGSLATYDGWKGADHIGKPIPMMVDRIKRMLANGQDVRIFTARIAEDKDGSAKKAIEAWTQKHIGQSLPITNVKDQHMTSLYDDRAIQVERNQGHILGSRRKAVAESA